MLSFVIALVMCLGAVAGLVLVAPSVFYSWRIAPAYYNLARIALPFIALGYFGPQLFGLNFPVRNGWISAGFLGGLGLIVVAILVYLYREPGDSHRRSAVLPNSIRPAIPTLGPAGLLVRTAQPEDLPGVGKIFAEAFHQSFDLDFGPDRARNACLLSELLAIKQSEVEVAVVAETGQIIGAMWLDLGAKEVPAVTVGQSWPILRRYLNGLHAAYFSLFALPTIMARRSTDEMGYIQWLGIDPTWQGRGVGYQMVERAIELSRAANKHELSLHTERSNERARKLYARTGFEDRSRFSFGPRVRYVKPLK